MPPLPDDLIIRLATALAIGLVVGIERGWREREAAPGSRTAGVRTYALSALLGGASAALSAAAGAPLVLAAAVVAFVAVFAVFKLREAEHDGDFSATGLLAAIIVFVFGALCVLGDLTAAAAGGVATACLLALRESLHSWLSRLTWGELRSALLLLAMSVIVLPILPDAPVDPFGAVNPREIWLFTVLIAGISFLGYVAVKIAGPSRGVLVSGLAGALVSSTAVTLAFARRAAAGEPVPVLAGGAALAGAVSILRVCAIVGFITPALLPHLAPAALAAAAVFGVSGLLMLSRGGLEASATTPLASPFELAPLLFVAAAFAAVALAGGWLTQSFGQRGILLTSGIFGLIDVDVAALTAARLARAEVPVGLAAQAILLALAVNAVARAVFGGVAGPLAYGLRLATATAIALAAAVIVLLLR